MKISFSGSPVLTRFALKRVIFMIVFFYDRFFFMIGFPLKRVIFMIVFFFFMIVFFYDRFPPEKSDICKQIKSWICIFFSPPWQKSSNLLLLWRWLSPTRPIVQRTFLLSSPLPMKSFKKTLLKRKRKKISSPLKTDGRKCVWS